MVMSAPVVVACLVFNGLQWRNHPFEKGYGNIPFNLARKNNTTADETEIGYRHRCGRRATRCRYSVLLVFINGYKCFDDMFGPRRILAAPSPLCTFIIALDKLL
jgi:hypothetical protein